MTEREPASARRRLRVGVLFGGRSGEHEVSLHSARAVMAALEQAGHEVVPIGITSSGRWLVAGDPMRALSSGTSSGEQVATMLPEPGHSGLMIVDNAPATAGPEPLARDASAEPTARHPSAEPPARDASAEPIAHDASAEPPARDASAEPPARDASAEPTARDASAEPPARDASADPFARDASPEPTARDVSAEPAALNAEQATPGNGLVATSDASRAGEASGASLDLVFPVLHGTYGEDGTVQGLFELASVPYAGSGVLGSALGMDKIVQKTLWRGLGLPVVDFVSVLRRDLRLVPDAVVERIEQSLGYPCFVKPANLGSSVGVSKARGREELHLALEVAARYDAKLLVERGVDARELEVAILGNHDPIASVVGEILPGAEFYDYRAKYLDTGSQALIPAEIDADTAARVQRLAIQAFQAVDAAGLARVDFFLERGTGTLYLNEINTMPGFTEISMYPKLWQASGLSFADLVARIAELALERHAERAENETSYRPE